MWSFGALVVRLVLNREPFELMMILDDEDKAADTIQVRDESSCHCHSEILSWLPPCLPVPCFSEHTGRDRRPAW